MAKIAKIMELYQMRRQVEDACRAFRSLDGELAKISLRPGDSASLAAAIRQMETAIDRKVAPFRGNKFVEPYVKPLKDKYCAAILAKAAAAEGEPGAP
jgi:protein-disulfide isomerase-like protein with CxxC motif